MEWHPYAEKFPDIEGIKWQEFKADIMSNGVQWPVEYRLVDGKKEGLDGRQRSRACKELGIDCPSTQVDVDDKDVRAFIIRRNVLRRGGLDPETRKEVAADLRAEGQSTRQIAAAVGVSQSTVVADLSQVNGDCSPAKVTGQDGKQYPASKPPVMCERCTRIGTPTPNCQGCIEARKPKTTRPPPSAAPKAPKKPKAGSETFNWHEYDKSLGVVARGPDDLARAYKGESDCHEYKQCINSLEEFTKYWKTWHKRLTKSK